MRLRSLIAAACAATTSVLCAQAALIGVVPTFPLITYDNQGVSAYTAATNLFQVDAQPLAGRLNAANPPRPIVANGDGSWQVRVRILVNNAGGLIGGTAGDDLIVQGSWDSDGNGSADFTGTLLTGEVLQFGFAPYDGTTTARFDFVFQPTGGSMAPQYAGRNLAMTLTSEGSTYTGSFAADFNDDTPSGAAKGIIGGTCINDTTPPTVDITVNPAPVPCPCDRNNDGSLTVADVNDFLTAYMAGNADYNGDGSTNINDFYGFFDCYYGSGPNSCGTTPVAQDVCDCSKPKNLTFQYTGQDCTASNNPQGGKATCSGNPNNDPSVFILIGDKSNPADSKFKTYFSGTVALGESFIVTPPGGGSFASNTYYFVYSDATKTTLLQTLAIHTSCSQSLKTGDRFGSLRLVGFTPSDPDCTNTPGPGTGPSCNSYKIHFAAQDDCSNPVMITAFVETECGNVPLQNDQVFQICCIPPAVGSDICEDEKPNSLTFKYTGSSCAASNNPQGGKATCSGDPANAASVYVVFSKATPATASSTQFQGTVALNGSFTVTPTDGKFNSNSYVFIYSDSSKTTLLQSLAVHTSCSQRLFLGDQFGSLLLTGFTNAKGGSGSFNPGGCSSAIVNGILQIFADFAQVKVIVKDSSNNTTTQTFDVSCPPVPPTPQDACEDGKPKSLTFKYTGDDCSASNNPQSGKATCSGTLNNNASVYIVWSTSTTPTASNTQFQGTVALDGSFTVTPASSPATSFSSNSYIKIYTDSTRTTLIQSLAIHTSCSQDLFTGNQFGSLLLTGFAN